MSESSACRRIRGELLERRRALGNVEEQYRMVAEVVSRI
jgi:hypothetical protein